MSSRSRGLIFDSACPTAFSAAPKTSNGFHQSSPVGSTYRSGLFTVYTYRTRDWGTVRWPRIGSGDRKRPRSGS
jgi:hypothetical protein